MPGTSKDIEMNKTVRRHLQSKVDKCYIKVKKMHSKGEIYRNGKLIPNYQNEH